MMLKVPTAFSTPLLVNRIRGLVFGQAIGDALGLATEFMDKEEARSCYGPNMEKLRESEYAAIVQDSHRRRWQSDWTDDTDQGILLLDSVIASPEGKLEPRDFARRLRDWINSGFPELGDTGGMGIGQTVFSVCMNVKFLKQPHETAKSVWIQSGKRGAANGAVMRTAVMAIPYFWEEEKVEQNTAAACLTTHADPRCLSSCMAVTFALSQLLCGKDDIDLIVQHALSKALTFLPADLHAEFIQHASAQTLSDLALDGPGIGYTLKCMGCGLYALKNHHNDFKETMLSLIGEGGDADTNCAVAGALVGCSLGFDKLPASLVEGLQHRKWLDAKVDILLAKMGLI